jgi:hypothetical protein
MLVTCTDRLSYAGGKTWRSLCKRKAELQFRSVPSSASQTSQASQASRESQEWGFPLGPGNSLVGPQSHELGIDANGAFTAALLFRPTAECTDAVPLRLYANAPGGVGLEVRMGCRALIGQARRTQRLLQAEVTVKVGSAAPLKCSPMIMDSTRRYLLVVSKDHGAVRVSAVDVMAGPPVAVDELLLATPRNAATESLRLSNVEMEINPEGRWMASIQAFAIFSSALAERGVSDLAGYLRKSLERFDPEKARQARLEAAFSAGRSCPFDADTCRTCGGVDDWSATSDSLFTKGGKECLSTIGRFCTSNPRHARCGCWDVAHPKYNGECRPYRAVFAGPVPPPPPPPPPSPSLPAVQQPLPEREHEREHEHEHEREHERERERERERDHESEPDSEPEDWREERTGGRRSFWDWLWNGSRKD